MNHRYFPPVAHRNTNSIRSLPVKRRYRGSMKAADAARNRKRIRNIISDYHSDAPRNAHRIVYHHQWVTARGILFDKTLTYDQRNVSLFFIVRKELNGEPKENWERRIRRFRHGYIIAGQTVNIGIYIYRIRPIKFLYVSPLSCTCSYRNVVAHVRLRTSW